MGTDKLPLAELLCAKFCHDMAGPIGAIYNGVELLAEVDGQMLDQATELLHMSSAEARAKLQVYRQAYGVISREGDGKISELKDLLADFFRFSKIKPEWADNVDDSLIISSAARRLVLNVMLSASNMLMLEGQLAISITKDADAVMAKIRCSDERIKVLPEDEDIFSGRDKGENMSVTNVQPHLTMILAAELEGEIEFAKGEGYAEFNIKIPTANV